MPEAFWIAYFRADRISSDQSFPGFASNMAEISLPIWQVVGEPTWNELFQSEPITFEKDWFGQSLVNAPTIFILLSDERLYFGAKWGRPAGGAQPPLGRGAFVEGLWEAEVVELFLGTLGSTIYQEINLSPQGAWWSCLFSSKRSRSVETPTPIPRVEFYADTKKNLLLAALSLPRAQLSVDFNRADQLRVNVCGVSTADGTKRYFTFATFNSREPDFHRPEEFCPIRLKSRHRL